MTKTKATPASTRLYALLARESPRAVVFRRGPSKQVLLVAWRTDDDTFKEGQWLSGRVYERRCDLSPNGDYLLYFAAKWKEPLASWTAVSRPPYFTAIALWPKGDAWGGGGLFDDDRTIRLNHRATQMQLAPEFHLPRRMKLSSLVPPGYREGEDGPIWETRLRRDGWTMVQDGKSKETKRGAKVWIESTPLRPSTPSLDPAPRARCSA